MILNANGRMRPVWLFTRFTLSLELFICLTCSWAWCFFFFNLWRSLYFHHLYVFACRSNYVVINCWCFSKLYFMILFIHSLTLFPQICHFLFYFFFLFHMHWLLSSFLRSQKVLICANFWWFRSPYCTFSFGNIARYCNGFSCLYLYIYIDFLMVFNLLCMNGGSSAEFQMNINDVNLN